jgi:hypothetical protein
MNLSGSAMIVISSFENSLSIVVLIVDAICENE